MSFSETFLLINIKKHVIRHNHLTALRYHKLRRRNTFFNYTAVFIQKFVNIKSNIVAYAVDDTFVENA